MNNTVTGDESGTVTFICLVIVVLIVLVLLGRTMNGGGGR